MYCCFLSLSGMVVLCCMYVCILSLRESRHNFEYSRYVQQECIFYVQNSYKIEREIWQDEQVLPGVTGFFPGSGDSSAEITREVGLFVQKHATGWSMARACAIARSDGCCIQPARAHTGDTAVFAKRPGDEIREMEGEQKLCGECTYSTGGLLPFLRRAHRLLRPAKGVEYVYVVLAGRRPIPLSCLYTMGMCSTCRGCSSRELRWASRRRMA